MHLLILFRQIIMDLRRHAEIYILGPVWGYLHEFYLSGMMLSSPYVWLSIFWAANWVLGTGLALTAPKYKPEERWQGKKSLQSVVKLMIWLCALLVATGIRRSQVTGGFIPAGMLELAGVITEGSYLLRNLGRVAIRSGNISQGNLLSKVADSAEDMMGSHTTTITSAATSENPPMIVVTETRVTTIPRQLPHGCPAKELKDCPHMDKLDGTT